MPKADTETSQTQKRKMAGYKAVISNSKSTRQAKAKAEHDLANLIGDASCKPTGNRTTNSQRKAKGKAKDTGTPESNERDQVQRGLNGFYIAIRGLHNGMHLANRAHRLVDRIADDPPNERLKWMKRIWEAVSASELMLLPETARNEAVGGAYAELEEERRVTENARKRRYNRQADCNCGEMATRYHPSMVCPHCKGPLKLFHCPGCGVNHLLHPGPPPPEDVADRCCFGYQYRAVTRQGVQEDGGELRRKD